MIENQMATRSQHSDHKHFGLCGVSLTFSWKVVCILQALSCIYHPSADVSDIPRYLKWSFTQAAATCQKFLGQSRLQLRLLIGVKTLKVLCQCFNPNELYAISLHLYEGQKTSKIFQISAVPERDRQRRIHPS